MSPATIVSSFLLGWTIGLLSKDSLINLWYAEQAPHKTPSPLDEQGSTGLAEAALEVLFEADTVGTENVSRGQLQEGWKNESQVNYELENSSLVAKELSSDNLQNASHLLKILSPDDVTPPLPGQTSVEPIGNPNITLEETFQERKITSSQSISIGDPSLTPENVRFNSSATGTIN